MTPGWHDFRGSLRAHYVDPDGDSLCGLAHFPLMLPGTHTRTLCGSCRERLAKRATAQGCNV